MTIKKFMSYTKNLKSLFHRITLDVEDLFLLESFQIKDLLDRVPKKEFVILLKDNPTIHRYLVNMYPPLSNFIADLFKEIRLDKKNSVSEEDCQNVLWEIADLIVYNKYPDVYDSTVEFNWSISEIIQPDSLEGKVVIDAGAGSGKLTFLVAQFAETVFAVEPARGFRQFMKEKAIEQNVKNLFVVDGFLDSIPLPDSSVDVLMTSNAIGWNLENELKDVKRVLKLNGEAIHLMQSTETKTKN